jgi:Domain of unknown function (DUF4442)
MKTDFLKTGKTESWKTWCFRSLMNWYPMYFGTGGKILFWASDSSEVHLRLRLNIWTYNYVGTIFGGSMFSASDPFYMVMLLRILGPSFVVWDKSAIIKYKKPARTTLYAKLEVTNVVLHEIKNSIKEQGHTTHDFLIQWIDKDGTVNAEIQRHCYIADKEFYKRKKGDSQSAKLEFKTGRK